MICTIYLEATFIFLIISLSCIINVCGNVLFSPFTMWTTGIDLRSQAWQQAHFRAELSPFSCVHILVVGFSCLSYAACLCWDVHYMRMWIFMYLESCTRFLAEIIYAGLKIFRNTYTCISSSKHVRVWMCLAVGFEGYAMVWKYTSETCVLWTGPVFLLVS